MKTKQSLLCECLERYLNKAQRQQDFIDYLCAEKIITHSDTINFKNSSPVNRYVDIVKKIDEAQNNDLIQLFNVEWNMLPKEIVEIVVVCKYTCWRMRWEQQ